MASSSSSSLAPATAPASAPGVDTNSLLKAANEGDLATFKLLVSDLDIRGSLTETLTMITDGDGKNALHYAAAGKTGSLRICKYLVDKVKMDVDRKEKKHGQTPLHLATRNTNYPIARYLLEKGANPNAATHKGLTPLHLAADTDKGHKKLTQMLIKKGADVNAIAGFGTPLHFAVTNDSKDIVEVLLDNQADPNVVSPTHYTPLMIGIFSSAIDSVKLLLKKEADANHISLSKTTPLALAAYYGELEITKCLLDAGADPNATDGSGLKPIITAAMMGNTEVVEALVSATTPIKIVPHWSVDGLTEHFNSEEATEEMMRKSEEHFLVVKSKGHEAFERKDYRDAIYWYTEAMRDQITDYDDAILLSYRSSCFVCLEEGHSALADAQASVEQRPDWPMAHFRVGKALMLLEEFDKAAQAFKEGLRLDKDDKELRLAYGKALEMIKKKQRS